MSSSDLLTWDPPAENWIMTGESLLRAASRHALIPDDDTQLTAGIAYPFSLAWARRSRSAWPVTTPGLTLDGRLGKLIVQYLFGEESLRGMISKYELLWWIFWMDLCGKNAKNYVWCRKWQAAMSEVNLQEQGSSVWRCTNPERWRRNFLNFWRTDLME